jgi:hypothetical protein
MNIIKEKQRHISGLINYRWVFVVCAAASYR